MWTQESKASFLHLFICILSQITYTTQTQTHTHEYKQTLNFNKQRTSAFSITAGKYTWKHLYVDTHKP